MKKFKKLFAKSWKQQEIAAIDSLTTALEPTDRIKKIKALESKSIEELYEILGEQLLSKTLAADEFSDEEKREEAIDWEKQQETSLRKAICSSYLYKVCIENPRGWEWVVIIVALADLIAPVVVGVSPVTVAALVLKKGLDKLCTESEQ